MSPHSGHEHPQSRAGQAQDGREWVSFEDPVEDRTWMFDVTFLASGWHCLYGHGCQGVLTFPAAELEQGCCSYGAHFTDEADTERVRNAADALPPGTWQYASRSRRGGALKRTSGGGTMTRLVDGACIFLNRPGFAGGAGCALHRAALEQGRLPLEFKPNVCWQLPLRRQDSVDSSGHVTSCLTQWDRKGWGEGGKDFAWWCSEATEAFRGSNPVYRSMAAELVAMIGPTLYLELAAYLDARRPIKTRPIKTQPVDTQPTVPLGESSVPAGDPSSSFFVI